MFNNVLSLSVAVLLYVNQPLKAPVNNQNIARNILLQPGLSIIAHRGGALEGRENSLSAIKQAIDLGADAVQIDVRITKDKELVLSADSNLQRLTGQNEKVEELDYEEIGPYVNEIINQYGGVYHKENELEKERPPKLEDVLELMDENAALLIIEEKLSSSSYVYKLLQLVKDKGLLNRVLLKTQQNKEQLKQVFGQSINVVVDEKAPQLIQNFLDGSMKEKEQLKVDVLESVYGFETVEEAPAEGIVDLLKFSEEEYVPVQEFASKLKEQESLVQIMNMKLKEQGIPVIYKVANKEADFEKAVEIGASAVVTDKVAELVLYMKEKERVQQKISQSVYSK